MNIRRISAIVFTILIALVVAFQLALAIGAPWGEYAMGGAFPGQLPPELRVGAVVQAVILLILAAIVLARAGIAFPRLARVSRWLIWLVVAFSVISLVLNLITPSGGERAIWAPVALILLVTALLVATAPPPNPSAP